MKKTLLTIATMVAGILTMNAQCTAVQSCTPGATGYCSTPSPSTSLPGATVGTAYSTDVQITLGTTATMQGQTVSITSGTITSITGMPSGILALLTPTNGALLGGQSGCFQLSGTTNATSGTYSVTVSFALTLNGGFPFSSSATWYLPLNSTTTGISNISNSSNGVLVLAPNPAKSELTISSDLHLNKATIIDALGKVVMTQDLNYSNQAIINVANLERGVYFLQANDGNKTITKKFIKD